MMWQSIKPILSIVLRVLMLVVCGVAGFVLNSSSFDAIRRTRELERIPPSEVRAVLPGKVNLRGAVVASRTLTGPKSGHRCVYFRYLVEKERRDSDGKTTWDTVEDRSNVVGFRLRDETGTIEVAPRKGTDFSIPQSFRRQAGSMRYTEWRIDPGDKVLLFGVVREGDTGYVVGFPEERGYTPLISKYSEAEERTDIATASLFMGWAGMVAFAFAVLAACWLLKIHRILVFLSVLTVVLTGTLCRYGVSMMSDDLHSAHSQLFDHDMQAVNAVGDVLADAAIDWSGDWAKLGDLDSDERYASLSPRQRARIDGIRTQLAVATRRLARQQTVFPESTFAGLWGLPAPTPIPLPPSVQAKASKLDAAFVPAHLGGGFAWVALLLGVVGVSVFSWLGFRTIRFKRYIEGIPTSKTAGVAFGLSEVKGVALTGPDSRALSGPVSGANCLHYRYVVKERVRRGKNTSWVVRTDETECAPFDIKDDEGTIRIDPRGAEVITKHFTSRRRGNWLYQEWRIETGDMLYVLAQAGIDTVTGASLVLERGNDRNPFIVSNLSEAEVMHRKAIAGMLWLNLGFSALLLAALFLFGQAGAFSPVDYLMAALVAPVYMLLIMLVMHFNDLIFLKQRADRAWANIDVSLKKRHDLIPNLEQTVKRYLRHEKQVLEKLSAMRESYRGGAIADPRALSGFLAAEQSFTTAFVGLRENYPELQADEVVGQLMQKLIFCDNEVALMRGGYNDAVTEYNTRLQTFPDNFLARLSKFEPKQLIEYKAQVLEVPSFAAGPKECVRDIP